VTTFFTFDNTIQALVTTVPTASVTDPDYVAWINDMVAGETDTFAVTMRYGDLTGRTYTRNQVYIYYNGDFVLDATIKDYVGIEEEQENIRNTPPLTDCCKTAQLAQSARNSANTGCTSCGQDDPCMQSMLPGNPQAGDPVNLANQEFTLSAVDLEIAGRGINYSFSRYYRSRISYHGPLGHNWEFPYNKRVAWHPTKKDVFVFYNGMGQGDEYEYDATNDVIRSPATSFNRMITEPGNPLTLSLREANGTIYNFYPLGDATADASPDAGRLSAIISRCNNRLTFAYNAYGQMTTVYDSLGRPILHEYDSTDDYAHLVKIKDFANREVHYTYDASDDLIKIRGPEVTGTPNGNDFTNGKEWHYTYSSGYADPYLNHNLLKITAPNDASSDASPKTSE
jgi:YD repeat-containing protein